MSLFTKVADVAHKGAVLGLMSVFVFQVWQIGKNTIGSGRVDAPRQRNTFFQELDEKIKEEYKKDNEISDSKARDLYQDGDTSFEQEQLNFKKRLADASNTKK